MARRQHIPEIPGQPSEVSGAKKSYSAFGSVAPRGVWDRGLARVVVVILVGSLVVAIAKPWSAPSGPTASASATQADAGVPTASGAVSGPAVQSALPAADPGPLPVAFTMPPAPPAFAGWREVRWRRLASDDPLALVTAVRRWSGGFLAVGWREKGRPSTPVWTSTDGAHWDPVPFGTSDTFWPESLITGVVTLPTGLVALAKMAPECSPSPCAVDEPPVVAWISADGRRWSPHVLPTLGSSTGSPSLLASGPAGLIATSSGRPALVVTSSDGVSWESLPVGTLPTGVIVKDLLGTAAGYVAVGLRVTNDGRWDPASLWSSDGRRWSDAPTELPASPAPGTAVLSAVTSVIAGRDGMIAFGRDVIWPGAVLWWESSDGRRWSALPGFPPLGPVHCGTERCTLEPRGSLVGDGQRLVALRGGADAGAWISTDGLAWSPVPMGGDVPDASPTGARLLPAGVLVTDGVTTWFGEGITS